MTKVMNPKPPIWMSRMMTIMPKAFQCTAVGTAMSPVTQVAEVAVSSASKKSVHSPLLEEMGSASRKVPKRIMPK